MAKKSTKAEVIRRVTLVRNMILDGLEAHEMLQYSTQPEENWGVNLRMIYIYIKYANERIKRQAERDDVIMFYQVKRRLQRQYKRAVQNNEGQLARLLLKDMRELYGFDQPKKMPIDEHGNAVTPQFNLFLTEFKNYTIEERREASRALQELDSNGKGTGAL